MYGEWMSSQMPAIELLQHIGYEYISPDETTCLRNNFYHPILTTILKEQLKKIHRYEYKG